MDVLGKIIAVILIVFLVFLHPLQYIYETNDTGISSYVSAKGTEFIDKICDSGTFTVKEFEDFKSQIGGTGELYDVTLAHTHLVTGVEESASIRPDSIQCLSIGNSTGELQLMSAGSEQSHSHTDDCYAGATIGSETCCPGKFLFKKEERRNVTGQTVPGNQGTIKINGQYVDDDITIWLAVYQCDTCGEYLNHLYCLYGWQEVLFSMVFISDDVPSITVDGQVPGRQPRTFSLMDLIKIRCTDASWYEGYLYYLFYYGEKLPPNKYGEYYASVCSDLQKYTWGVGTYLDTDGIKDAVIEICNMMGYSPADIEGTHYADDKVRVDLTRVKYSGWYDLCAQYNQYRVYLDRSIGHEGWADEHSYYYAEFFECMDLCEHYPVLPDRTVCDQIVQSILPAEPNQTIKQGEEMDRTAIVTYLNGDTKTVTCSSSFSSNTIADGQNATLCYDGYAKAADVTSDTKTTFTCNVSVNVKSPKRLSSIQANLMTNKINRYEEFPIRNLTLKFDNGEEMTVEQGWQIQGFSNSSGGHQTVTVSYQYEGVTCSTNVSIFIRQLAAITVNMASTTITKYDEFPITDLKLTYNDGTTEAVDSGWEIDHFINNTKGTYNVVVSYTVLDITCYDYVTIHVHNLTRICQQCQEEYELNDHDYDEGCPYCKEEIDHLELSQTSITLNRGEGLDGIIVSAVYKDGHKQVVEGWLSDFQPNILGTQSVTITYGRCDIQLLVTNNPTVVCPVCGQSYELNEDGSNPGCPHCAEQVVSITASPTEVRVRYGESLSIQVMATYQDGHSARITDYTTNFDNHQEGMQIVSIYHKGFSTTITVEVIRHMEICPICNQTYDPIEQPVGCPECRKALISFTAHSFGGGNKVQMGSNLLLELSLLYRDNHREMKYNGYSVENYDANTLGMQNVTVRYEHLSCNLTIEVVNTLLKTTCRNGHIYALNDDGTDPGCPYCSDSNQAVSNTYLSITYTDEILKKLYEDGQYDIPEGDYISITISRRDPLVKVNSLLHLHILKTNPKFTYGGKNIE